MNMFISKGERLLAALGLTGAAVALYGGILYCVFGASEATACFLFTCQLAALIAFAAAQALLPDVVRDE